MEIKELKGLKSKGECGVQNCHTQKKYTYDKFLFDYTLVGLEIFISSSLMMGTEI